MSPAETVLLAIALCGFIVGGVLFNDEDRIRQFLLAAQVASLFGAMTALILAAGGVL